MLTLLLNYSLVLFGLFSTVPAFPTAPLNERNKEVSWEAWLLVDDQNQNRPVELETPRRRIVPKSIFFTQTFSPENLPPCEEGHSRDERGMCVKLIKLDEDKHLGFLVSKLNAQFGGLDYDTEFDPNSEPTRVDIPLGGDYDVDYANLETELDMAIIVTPTTRDVEPSGDDSKVGKRDDAYEEQLKMLKGSTTESSELTTTEAVETTTKLVENNEEVETSTFPTTTTQDETTEQTTMVGNSDTTSTETITTSTVTEQPETTTFITTTTPKITTYHPVATTYHPYIGLDWMPNQKTKNLISFPVEDVPMPRSHPSRHLVRFPDVDDKVQQEGQGHHTRDVNDQTGNFFNEIVTPQPSERVQNVVLPPRGHVAGFYDNHKQPKSATTEKHSMKKAKQSLFVLPPDWSPQDPKPIVLRFSRKHLHLITNKFKNGEFYRSLPVEDLTYLFGYKNGQSRQHR